MGVIVRQTIISTLSNYLGLIVGFVATFFVLTDCLSPEEIGLTRILVDAAMLFSSLAMLGSSSSIVRFFPYFHSDESDHGFFGWAMLLPLAGYALFVVCFILFRPSIEQVYSANSPLFVRYVYYLLPLTFFALYMTVFESCANVLMHIAVPKFVREVVVRVCNLVSYLLYGYGAVSFDVFVLLFCSSYALATLIDFCFLLSLGKITFRLDIGFLNKKLAKQVLEYTLLVTVVSLTANVQLLNSIFLGAKQGLALAGIFSIGLYISNVVSVPSRSLTAIANPIISQSIKENNHQQLDVMVKKVSLHQLLITSTLYLFIVVNLSALYSIIPHGDEYVGGIGVVVILGVSNILQQTLAPMNSVLNFSNRYIYSLPFSLLMSLTAIFLNLWLIPIFGTNGAALATLGAIVVYNALTTILVAKKIKVHPFSAAQLKIVGIMVLLFSINFIWSLLLSPLFATFNSTFATIVDAVLKTVLLAVTCLIITYRANISTDINDVLIKMANRVHIKLTQK